MSIYIAPSGVSFLVHGNEGANLIRQGYKLYDESAEDLSDPDSPIDIPDFVNINTADASEIVTKLAVSIATAKALIASRPHADTSALADIKGIDLAKIESKIGI